MRQVESAGSNSEAKERSVRTDGPDVHGRRLLLIQSTPGFTPTPRHSVSSASRSHLTECGVGFGVLPWAGNLAYFSVVQG